VFLLLSLRFFFFFFFFCIARAQSQGFCMLGKCSTTELHSQPHLLRFNVTRLSWTVLTLSCL
jgi:hypothetical protein